ncbi:MAG: antibiotic biosynthesis monooxygenase [Bacteroidetes bacterium]|nr:antibiotic biosynthesis monooxygenase [Bacteroidota bacterium]MDA1120963.1 antibiotic biosynthesis monooxygenase [Bacteroidota bacterium]
MTDNVYWVLELSIKDGQLNNFQKLMNEMVEATKRDEPGALNYEWWLSEDKSACHIYERYADSDAAMAHLGNFGSKFAERFMTYVDPTRFMVYGKSSAQVKEALAGFGAVFMQSFGGFGR